MQKRGLLRGYRDLPWILYQCNIVAKCCDCKELSYIDYYRGKYDYDNNVRIERTGIYHKCGGLCKIYTWNPKKQSH